MAVKKKTPAPRKSVEESTDELPPEMLGFSARLEREMQRKLGDAYSQTHVALLSGVSQPTISNLIKKPLRMGFRLSTVLKIAKALDLSLDVLLLDRPNPWHLLTQAQRMRRGRLPADPPDTDPESPPRPQRKT